MIVLLGVLVLTCGREREPAPALSLAKHVTVTRYRGPLSGCYRAEWQPANPFPRYGSPPKSFELTNVPVERGAKWFLIKGDSEFLFAEWEPVSEKEAQLDWSTGFVGVSVSLALPEKEGVLYGVANTFADVPERPDTAKVKLIRVGC